MTDQPHTPQEGAPKGRGKRRSWRRQERQERHTGPRRAIRQPDSAMREKIAYVPVSLAWDTRVGYTAMRALLTLWGMGAGYAWVPLAASALADILGVSLITAQRALAELVDARYIHARRHSPASLLLEYKAVAPRDSQMGREGEAGEGAPQ